MMELLSEEPLFEDRKEPKSVEKEKEEKRQFWRNDRYKLYQPAYECSWNDQEYVGDLSDLCETIIKGNLLKVQKLIKPIA